MLSIIKIKEYMTPKMNENGYICHKKEPCFYRERDNVLSFVFFMKKSYYCECGIYVLPLYVLFDTFYMELGDSIAHIDFKNRQKYTLCKDQTTEQQMVVLSDIYKFIAAKAYPWFDKVGTPAGLYNNVSVYNRRNNYFFTSPYCRYKTMAYSAAYLGNASGAEKHFGLMIEELKSSYITLPDWPIEVIRQAEEVMTLLKKDTSLAKELLTENANTMRKRLMLI